jgi:hypothetical protein
MSQRRMFSKRITNSGKFLKMPQSSQSLYFHLGMEADDDGVVEAYHVMKLTNANEDDLRVLVAKEFIKILNDDMVSFIMDWNEHNLIRPDRKINSIYKDLLLQVYPEADIINPKPRADTGLLTQSQKRSSTEYLPSNFRAKLLPLFDGKPCPVCNQLMYFNGDKDQTSIQHNKAISRGGQHRIENISVICFSCNMKLKSKDTDSLNNDEVVSLWLKLNGRQMDDKWTAQDRLGKVSIDKVKIDESIVDVSLVTVKETKTIYGEYKHVKLTDKEKERLIIEFGENFFRACVRKLDEYIQETGKKYKDHNLTIRRWVISAVKKDGIKPIFINHEIKQSDTFDEWVENTPEQKAEISRNLQKAIDRTRKAILEEQLEYETL